MLIRLVPCSDCQRPSLGGVLDDATVTEDAELALWTAEALESLLRENPALCQELLGIMAERLAENHELMKALLRRRKPPSQKSSVA